ncbi:MAG: ABC-F family ATP-binding cassette domain-containing protein [Thermotogae bacterium]|nr:ABC-F family ATP-binding cassette domain-containing protein [Thermotogota bacterium]
MLIRLEEISHNFGDQDLFYDVNLPVYENDRIALIGQNGSGKTTLLKIMEGETEPSDGQIIKSKNLKIGFLKQFRIENPEEDVYSYVEKSIEGDVDDILLEKSTKSILNGLGFREDDWSRAVKSLSGGELTRISLGKTLAGTHNLLLLDEPTNHLDLYSIKWLERYLMNYKGAIILVSHDRNFIKNICNKYWELNNYNVWDFKGTYDKYISQRENYIMTTEAKKANLMKEIERTEKMIERFKKWATPKMVRQAIIRERTLNKLKKEFEEINEITEDSNIKIKIPEPSLTGYKVLTVKNLSFGYDNETILKNISFEVNEGEKVSIIGKNGCGKSTLLKILMDKLKQKSGEFEWGYNIKIGYLDQVISSFDKNNTVLKEVWKIVEMWPDYEVRKYIGRFGFTGDNVFKDINTLSGGELTRLALAKLILTKPNILILDEPTNHLDILTVQALEETLKDFKGSIILVSHDETLLKNLSDKFVFINEGFSSVSDNLDDFISVIKEDSFKIKKDKKNIIDYEEDKKQKNRKRFLERRLEDIRALAEDYFHELDAVEKEMYKNATDYSKITKLTEKKSELEKFIDDIEKEEKEINSELLNY